MWSVCLEEKEGLSVVTEVIKRDGQREPFRADKIVKSILYAMGRAGQTDQEAAL